MISNINNRLTDRLSDLTKAGAITTYMNPYQYFVLRNHKDVLEVFDNIVFDGFLLSKLFFVLGFKLYRPQPPDLSGFLKDVFSDCNDNSKSVVFVGGKSEEIKLAVEIIQAAFSKIRIVDFRSGYFSSESEKDVFACEILKQNPDFVFVGMGVPHQEKFSAILKKKKFRGSVITCGGFFHQTARRLNYYPKFFNQLNIRWVYRIIDEPRLFYRYFVIYPISLTYFIFDVLKYRLSDNNRSTIVK